MPPPTWNEAIEMPKNSTMRSPASALIEITQKAANELMRTVRRRPAGSRFCVKWMKKGTTPTGLTMASRAIRGLNRSMRPRPWVRGAGL
jgi:hypothetical protein